MKGIPFMPEMALAVYQDRKTVTRRIVGHQHLGEPKLWTKAGIVGVAIESCGAFYPCEYQPGRTYCLLATWAVHSELDKLKPKELAPVLRGLYAGKIWHAGMGRKPDTYTKTRPGRFIPDSLRDLMPKIAMVGVRVERLQDITPDDAEREGLSRYSKDGTLTKYGIADYDGMPGTDDLGWPWSDWRISPVDAFERLWDNINAKPKEGMYAWAKNPYVLRYEFRRVTP